VGWAKAKALRRIQVGGAWALRGESFLACKLVIQHLSKATLGSQEVGRGQPVMLGQRSGPLKRDVSPYAADYLPKILYDSGVFTLWVSWAGRREAKIIRCFWKSISGCF